MSDKKLTKIEEDMNTIALKTAELKKENEALRASNSELLSNMETKRAEMAQFTKDHEVLGDKVKALNVQSSELKQTVDLLEGKVKNLNNEIAEKQIVKNKLNDDIVLAKEKLEQTLKEVNDRSHELDERENILRGNEISLENYRAELDQKKAILDKRQSYLG